jgi:phosphoglycerol transferase MdoB-like AlkP superfamily enzyme
VLLFISLDKSDLTIFATGRIFALGLLFDLGVAICFVLPYALYLWLLPARWNHSIFNRIVTFFAFCLSVFIIIFSFFAEVTFWLEFESRFNFIAVDYLVYTYEVVNNINESYPLPLLISIMLLVTSLITWLFVKRKYFAQTFQGNRQFLFRLGVLAGCTGIFFLYFFTVNNSLAEQGNNRYQNELAKTGIYSFFAAYRNNELNYDQFYKLEPTGEAFSTVRNALKDRNTFFANEPISIRRDVMRSPGMPEKLPNVIMVTVESLSADFLAHFGNTKRVTPTLDSLWDHSIRFAHMYATGTRTVRGMEALTLASPPTPGNSIVRRPGNDNLTTVGQVFRQKGYATGFFYGGDGYFDNMNQFFGSNGYSITDRGRSILATDDYSSPRNIIPDSLVHFENAWGICDEDVYDAVIRDADEKYRQGRNFYDFVMTTSNHRPYTYPSGEIDIPSGTGRDGAVKYTDYAIKQLLEKIKAKPWFKNTILIIVADHCASSAGKDAIDVSKYHIPALICNLDGGRSFTIEKECSQIDLYPTLFALLNWNYTSNFYGRNVLSPAFQPGIFLGTYQKLAYLRNDSLVILSPQQKAETFEYDSATNKQKPRSLGPQIVNEAISYYETAYYLFKHEGLKQKPRHMAAVRHP